MSDRDYPHFYDAVYDLLERRLAILFAKTGPEWRHYVGPVYDPARGGAGDGRTCTRCRRISRSDARLCGSCGTVLGVSR